MQLDVLDLHRINMACVGVGAVVVFVRCVVVVVVAIVLIVCGTVEVEVSIVSLGAPTNVTHSIVIMAPINITANSAKRKAFVSF